MNLNQLVYANEIKRQGSFSKAAQTLYISQSALSKSIHTLEQELEQEIFIRTTEGVSATEYGRLFLVEAEKALQHVDKIRRMAAKPEVENGQPLYFSASCGQMLFASEIFARLLAEHLGEKTDFHFYQKTCSEVFADVKEGRSDVGVLVSLNTYQEEAVALFAENDMEYYILGKLGIGAATDRNNPIHEYGVSRLRKSHLSEQTLLVTKEVLAPFSREVEELQNAFDNPPTVYVADNDTAISLCKQIPAFFCVAQSNKIYNKLNLPLSMVIYPYQNMNLKYEFGWIKKRGKELTRVEKQFIEEIQGLFR